MGRLDQYGAGLGRLAGFGSTAQPNTGGASPLATALSTATGLLVYSVNYTVYT